MQAAVVDSVILLDHRNRQDRDRHRRARAIVDGIDSGTLPTGRVTNYLALETLNLLDSRLGKRPARDTYDRLSSSHGFEITQTTQEDFDRAVDLFRTYDGLSFGDATTVAYMRRAGVRYLYSFDDDFDAVEGLVRLDSGVNPFRPS